MAAMLTGGGEANWHPTTMVVGKKKQKYEKRSLLNISN
jgi:hypothetical protein